ncbi:GPI-anchor transamidase complex protein [Malassezia pachydermatis]
MALSSSAKDETSHERTSFQRSSLHISIIAALVAVTLAALPVWWSATTIVRRPLPVDAVRAWHAQGACPLRTAWTIHMDGEHIDASTCTAVYERLLHRQGAAPTDDLCIDWAVVGSRGSEHRVCDIGVSNTTEVVRVPVHTHGSAMVPEVLAYLAPLLGAPTREDARPIEYAPRVRLVFSLMQEDASEGRAIAQWGLTEAFHASASVHPSLAPLHRLIEAVRPIHDIVLETQVQWYAPLEFSPTTMYNEQEGQISVLSMDDISVFINSPQWSLESYGTSAMDERTLHFILFVPRPHHAPLYLQKDHEIIRQPAWLVPQWGGVVVWNRYLDGSVMAEDVSLDELRVPMQLYTKQLLALLGLEYDGVLEQDALLDLAVRSLQWRRALQLARESVDTLTSIVRLVHKIPNLGVDQDVQRAFTHALDDLHAAKALSLPGRAHLDQLLSLVTSAQSHASQAFFDPSMLEMLYFPNEHKYAVYTPLFGPLLLPLLTAMAREWKYARRHRRR